ncbi:MAG: stage III sporulation protein AG [Hydrogenibacillus schlegelii]|nr:stage III sporulation protein AG [Hydrogenibacillus schlegelii]
MDGWTKARTPLLLAVALLAVSLFAGGIRVREGPPPAPAKEAVAPATEETMAAYEARYAAMLTEVLEQVLGVGRVTVMVNLDSTEERVYEKNTRTSRQETVESDAQGGRRTIGDATVDEEVVRLAQGGGEAPVVVKTLKPRVRGVVVVAEGAESGAVRAWITDVVSRALDVPPHRVAVVPKKAVR